MTRNELIERLVEAAIRQAEASEFADTKDDVTDTGWFDITDEVEHLARQLKEMGS